MNIRSVSNPTPTDAVKSTERKASESSKDRDPNSQQDQGHKEQKKKFTDEELQQLVDILKKHPGVEQNNLKVVAKNDAAVSVIVLEDHLGNTVRRISGADLNDIKRPKEEPRGHVLNKTA